MIDCMAWRVVCTGMVGVLVTYMQEKIVLGVRKGGGPGFWWSVVLEERRGGEVGVTKYHPLCKPLVTAGVTVKAVTVNSPFTVIFHM